MTATAVAARISGESNPIRRRRTVTLILTLATLVLALVGLRFGDDPMSLGEVLAAIAAGPDGGYPSTVVLLWRAPRVVGAICFGAALGIAGALFQTLTRNPLGSPDIIGFTTGAYTGAIISVTVVGTAFMSTATGALLGGFATAVVVYLLAYRGGLSGFRLIIVGIGITAMLSAFNTWLLLRAQTEVAMAASIWGAGSINLVSWSAAAPVLITLAVLAPVVMLTAPSLRQLELGDDAARAHGVAVEPVRLLVLAVGVALTATVTAAAGPIAFIALVAPQVAHRLTRSAGLPLLGSALVGGMLLLLADLAAQFVVPMPVPVGAVTVVVGGLYLIALLVVEARRRRS